MATRLQIGEEDRPGNGGTILLVEDNPDDASLAGLALKKLAVDSLVTVSDGREALDYLMGQSAYADRDRFPSPNLILLDLDMPRMDGFEVLAWVRQQPALRHLPVIVLTLSTSSPDVNRAYRLGANSVVVKPPEFTQLQVALKGIVDFWLLHHSPINATQNERTQDQRQSPQASSPSEQG